MNNLKITLFLCLIGFSLNAQRLLPGENFTTMTDSYVLPYEKYEAMQNIVNFVIENDLSRTHNQLKLDAMKQYETQREQTDAIIVTYQKTIQDYQDVVDQSALDMERMRSKLNLLAVHTKELDKELRGKNKEIEDYKKELKRIKRKDITTKVVGIAGAAIVASIVIASQL